MPDRLLAPRAALGSAFSFLVIGLTCYFAYAALQGDTGLVEQVRLAREEAELTARLEDLQARRAHMNNLTTRLSDGFLDLDLLDERARAMLGYARPDEIVIR
ncbi:MAG: septum formation initiator family protein [Pseudomonadota bacterium]